MPKGAMKGGKGGKGRAAPYGLNGADRDSVTVEKEICQTHNKVRNKDILREENGSYFCDPMYECKMPSENATDEDGMPLPLHVVKKGSKGKGKVQRRSQFSMDAEPVETAMCQVHGKERQMMFLVDDGEGNLQCTEEAQCKLPKNQEHTVGKPLGTKQQFSVPARRLSLYSSSTTGKCSVHGKFRGWSVLEDDGYKGFKCMEGEECKTKEGEEPYNPGTGICVLHDKKRKLEHLVDEGGELRCGPDSECKIPSVVKVEPEEEKILENGLTANEQGMCSVHQKMRAGSNLQMDGIGGFTCVPESECKPTGGPPPPRRSSRMTNYSHVSAFATAEKQMCSVHQKMRIMSCMEVTNTGEMRCIAAMQCR